MAQTWQTFDEAASGTSVYDALIYQRTRTVSLATMFAGTGAPSSPTPVDGSPWVDTSTGDKQLKLYLDSAWREVCVLGYTQLTTAEIGDATITTAKLVDANVTTAKIAALAVTAAKMAADSVITAKILDANVTAGKLAADSVTTVKILDGAVTGAKLAAGAGGWSVTSVTGTYAATAGQFLVATGGNYWITLPVGPATGDRVGVYLNEITAPHKLTISSGDETFSPAISSDALNKKIELWIAGDRAEVIYDGTRWVAISREYVTPGIPDAVIEDQKTAGTDGGGLTADTWTTRTLQTLTRNNGSLISLGSNQITPRQDGWVEWETICHYCNEVRTRLYNVTDTAAAGYGMAQDGYLNLFNQGLTGGCAVVAGKAYSLQVRSVTYSYPFTGLGNASASASGATEIYSRVKYWRN